MTVPLASEIAKKKISSKSYEEANKYGIKVGGIYKTNNYGEVKVVLAENSNSIQVEFLGTGFIRTCRAIDLHRGVVGGLIYGRGYNLATPTKDSCGKILKVYDCWRRMLHRTSDSWWDKHPTYRGTTLTEEWFCYDNFYKWYADNCPDSSWDLDKDLLGYPKLHYSPQTCCFLPEKINKAIVHYSPRLRKKGGYYEVYYRGKFLKSGKDKEALLTTYAESKQKYIRTLSKDYHNLAENVKNALDTYVLEVVEGVVERL